MYEKELVMGILIAATSLLGLSGIFLVYAQNILERLDREEIRQKPKEPKYARIIPQLLKMSKASLGLSISIILGFITIVLTLFWFLLPNVDCLINASLAIFIAQVTFFILSLKFAGILFRRINESNLK